jgi:hypothetical protein
LDSCSRRKSRGLLPRSVAIITQCSFKGSHLNSDIVSPNPAKPEANRISKTVFTGMNRIYRIKTKSFSC